MLKKIMHSEKLLALEHALRAGDSVLIEELWNAPKAAVTALAQLATGKNILLLTGSGQEESRLFHDFKLFTDRPVVEFPAWETLPSENIAPSPDVVGERYKVLSTIKDSPEPHIILTGLQACLQRLIPPKSFNALYLTLKVGVSVGFQNLIKQLEKMGYQRGPVSADKGEFAVRGGIVDVYPVSSPDPFRIEFFGDEIDSIRRFDPIGQKSIEKVEDIEITPAREAELLAQADNLGTILDYLGPETLIIFDDLLALEDRYASLVSIAGQESRTFCSLEKFLELVEPFQKMFWSDQPIEELSEVQVTGQKSGYYSDSAPLHALKFEIFNRKFQAKRWPNSFVPLSQFLLPERENSTGEELLLSISRLAQTDISLNFLCETEAEKQYLQKLILEKEISLPNGTLTTIAYLSSGFVLPDIRLILFPMTEVTQRYKIRRQKLRSTYHTALPEMYDLIPGDAVVHMHNGIGRFMGVEKKPSHTGLVSEFLTIEYADKAKLFVPINQAHLVSKYVGSTEEEPKLHQLGGTRWKRIKEQTEKAIVGYASELLELYAKRSIQGGFAYPPDSPDVLAFEDEFPFVETEDQLSAIAETKKDLISVEAMDRLVCGDVGYGKTEVAMRAAFKAVVDGGKQVAILVPTTVLALQHFENFTERMRHFPINIGVLSRFRSPKEIRKTLDGLAEGKVDIVIGTHRLISKDVVFKDLGLIIIDEEQRFGVKAKEHLKKFKIGVDCLTLSATPIPRTLYFSLIGARDMSVINTPPQDRLPIHTIIAEPFDNIIKNAILRELSRDGQVFFIHNRVETIFGVADRLKKLLPQARIVVGHGQMSADELDTVFHAFKSGKADILVSTTIVENGIDIPNANTILIDKADHFGLADLYQLRGRVGRWNRRAYAYFLVPHLSRLPDMSRKRLQAIAEAGSGYGGGMKIAMRDLEIRGAGDILGTEQSGHVSAIGFYLYCKLLKRTIKALEGKISPLVTDTKIEHQVDARLPEDYVNDTRLRMEIYQRLGEALAWEEVDTIWEELKDRFGPPSEPVQWLYHLTRIRVYASLNGYAQLKIEKAWLTAEHKGKDGGTLSTYMKPAKSPDQLETHVLQILERKKTQKTS